MNDQTNRTAAKRTLSLSVILGTLLVPLSAVAAIWLTAPSDAQETEEAVETTTTTQPETQPSELEAVFAEIGASRADLEAACGPAGLTLVALEQDETISEIQQAALDALREICEQEGIPLPAKAASDPVVQTVVVTQPSVGAPAGSSDDNGYDDDHEDDDHHEDHDDHEADDHHEDD